MSGHAGEVPEIRAGKDVNSAARRTPGTSLPWELYGLQRAINARIIGRACVRQALAMAHARRSVAGDGGKS